VERVGGYLTKRLPPQQKGPQQRLWLGAKENNKAELFTARKLTRFLEVENWDASLSHCGRNGSYPNRKVGTTNKR